MITEILAFTEHMIPQAGQLLAARHARNRKRLPLLPVRFEELQIATQAIGDLWQKKLKNGFAAFRDGRMVAYLIGETTTLPWGRSGYVYLPGYALADGESPEILQDLYAVLGDDWVRKGNFNHYLYVSAADGDVLEALFDVGFGRERVDALLDLRAATIPEVEAPAGVTVRQAIPGDNHHLGSLSGLIARALADAPYWHPSPPEHYDELYEGWSELPDEKEWTVWLALENQEALGSIAFRAENEEPTQMLASPQTVYLSVAATQPQARGRGISTALTWHGLRQARAAGFEVCYTNWISPNLLASRFWPRFGFQDVAYRLAKKVSAMIAWTRNDS